jgi:hypothetical protein
MARLVVFAVLVLIFGLIALNMVLVTMNVHLSKPTGASTSSEATPWIDGAHPPQMSMQRPSLRHGSLARVPPRLPSGWDAVAWEAYKTRRSFLWGRVATMKMEPLGWFRVADHPFWPKMNNTFSYPWEPETMQLLFDFVDAETNYVDFGTWIGPTLLFAGQLAARSFGIEADPCAFAEMEVNVALNAHEHEWARRIHLQAGCVGTGIETMTMKALDFCSSGAAFTVDWRKAEQYKSQSDRPLHAWNVTCYDLRYLFQEWDIDVDKNAMMRIDVESYECVLLPYIADWFARDVMRGGSKPTIIVSMHGYLQQCANYSRIGDLCRTYTFAKCLGDGVNSLTGPVISPTGEFQCTHGEVVLSDRKPTYVGMNAGR